MNDSGHQLVARGGCARPPARPRARRTRAPPRAPAPRARRAAAARGRARRRPCRPISRSTDSCRRGAGSPRTRAREGVFERALAPARARAARCRSARAGCARAAPRSRRAGRLERLAAAAVLAGVGRESTKRAGRAALGGGVGDALDEHLVVVDLVPVRGDLPRARERLRDQALGGGEQQAGVVEAGRGGIGILWRARRRFREKRGRLG